MMYTKNKKKTTRKQQLCELYASSSSWFLVVAKVRSYLLRTALLIYLWKFAGWFLIPSNEIGGMLAPLYPLTEELQTHKSSPVSTPRWFNILQKLAHPGLSVVFVSAPS